MSFCICEIVAFVKCLGETKSYHLIEQWTYTLIASVTNGDDKHVTTSVDEIVPLSIYAYAAYMFCTTFLVLYLPGLRLLINSTSVKI